MEPKGVHFKSNVERFPLRPKSGQKPKQKQRTVLVSHPVPPSSIAPLDVDVGDAGVFQTPLGIVSPVQNKNQFARSSSDGKVIPHTILGNVEDYLKFVQKDESNIFDKIKKLKPRKSLSASFEAIRVAQSMSRASSRAHSAKLPLSPASKRESLTPSEVRSLGSLPQEDVFNRIRTVAHDNIRDSEEKGLLNVFEAKQNKFKMLVEYERSTYDRQQRAMERWERWQEEWRCFQESMCERMGKSPKDLIVSRVYQVREKKEEYDFINAATPHNEKHGDEYWQMSLRGIGTRYVAVGNIFSGIFCPIREIDNPQLEAVRLSTFYQMGNNNKIGSQKKRALTTERGERHSQARKSWRDAPILKARRARVQQRLDELRPHEASDEDLHHLEVQGVALFEWAYNSMEQQQLSSSSLPEDDNQGNQAGKLTSSSAGPQASQNETHTGPNINVFSTSEGSAVRKDGSLRVLMENYTGQPTSGVICIENIGTTAIYYTWTRGESHVHKVECEDVEGVVLPLERKYFTFTFVSPVAGSWTETWKLSTAPRVKSSVNFQVEFRAVSMQLEVNKPTRDRLLGLVEEVVQEKQLGSMAKDVIHSIVDTIPDKDPPFDVSETFVDLNRPLGLYYHEQLWPRVQRVSIDLHMLLYTGSTRPLNKSLLQQETRAQDEHERWLRQPSLKQLTNIFRKIKQDEALHPREHLPTLPDHDAEHTALPLSEAFTQKVLEYDEQMRAKIAEEIQRIYLELEELMKLLALRPASAYSNSDLFRTCIESFADAVVDSHSAESREDSEALPLEKQLLGHSALMEERIFRRLDAKSIQVLGTESARCLSHVAAEEFRGKVPLLYQRVRIKSAEFTYEDELHISRLAASWKELLSKDSKVMLVLLDIVTEDDAFDFATLVEEAQSKVDQEIQAVEANFKLTIEAAIEEGSKAKGKSNKTILFLNGLEFLEQEDDELDEMTTYLDSLVEVYITDAITLSSTASYRPPNEVQHVSGVVLQSDLDALKRCLDTRSFVLLGGETSSLEDQVSQLFGLLRLGLAQDILLVGSIAKRMLDSVTDMSDISIKLFSGDPFTPEDLLRASVFHTDKNQYPAHGEEETKVNERLREVFFAARSAGVRIILPLDPQTASAPNVVWDGSSGELPHLWESLSVSASSCILLGSGSPEFNTFMVRQIAAMGKAQGTRTLLASAEQGAVFETLVANEELFEDEDGEDEGSSEDEESVDAGKKLADNNEQAPFDINELVYEFGDVELLKSLVTDNGSLQLPLVPLAREDTVGNAINENIAED